MGEVFAAEARSHRQKFRDQLLKPEIVSTPKP